MELLLDAQEQELYSVSVELLSVKYQLGVDPSYFGKRGNMVGE